MGSDKHHHRTYFDSEVTQIHRFTNDEGVLEVSEKGLSRHPDIGLRTMGSGVGEYTPNHSYS